MLAVLISACSLAGDVAPPPALATAQMAAPAEPPTPAPLIPPSTQPDLVAGETIFADKCAPCHGLGGLGDGELASGLAFAPSPLGDPEFASAADPADWYRAVTIGNFDRLMPGFASLTNQERWDVVGYAFSLSSTDVQVEEPVVAEQPEPDLQPGSVTGRVSMGSTGADLPDDLQVLLLGYDGDQQVVSETTTPETDGEFLFEDVEYVPGRLFFATVDHRGMTYRSDVAHTLPDGGALDLPITIFETSQDSGSLRVERLHLIFDFPTEDTLRVLELWVLANDSDRVLITPLQIALPEDATNLLFDDGMVGDRYQMTGDGFLDLEPIPPGSGIDQLAFGFDLPISGSTKFDQLMRHPVDAVTILIPADGPQITGLEDLGVQDIGGLRMQSYAIGSLAAEEPLSFRVSGPSLASTLPIAAIVGAGALVIAGLVAARFWFGARQRPQTVAPENYVEAIARLDDDYENGVISEDDWRRQRERQMRKALDQMEGTDD
jgi:mono/diheme cytochrome c family protein